MDLARRGGLTGCRKTAIVCEAFGIKCEIHMAGWGNLQAMGATSEDTSEYYEKGLLAPGAEYDAPHPYLHRNCDPIDAGGMITLPLKPGCEAGYKAAHDAIWPEMAALMQQSDVMRFDIFRQDLTLPTVPQVAAMAAHVGRCLTVIGGAAGSYMIEEYRRGARGTMPFCSQPEDFVAVWNHLQAGEEAAARNRLDNRIMAINRLGAQEGDLFYHFHKQILKHRGIIKTAFVHGPTVTLSPTTQAEIDRLLDLS